jgi:hypothetical protein
MKLTHKFAEMTPEKRPQDPHMDGTGLRIETLEHGGEYPAALSCSRADGFTVINSPRPKAKLIDQQPVAREPMQKPPLDPDVADTAPSDSVLTVYDEEHLITYLRLLDADAEGADWREVARIVLHLDPEHESDRSRRAFDSHLSRAKWMTEHGYRHLLRGGASVLRAGTAGSSAQRRHASA